MSNNNSKPQTKPQKPLKPDNTREKSEDFAPKPTTKQKK